MVRSMTCAAFPWLWEPSRDLPLSIHSHIMAAGDSGIPMRPGSLGGGDAVALKPPKADVPPVGN